MPYSIDNSKYVCMHFIRCEYYACVYIINIHVCDYMGH